MINEQKLACGVLIDGVSPEPFYNCTITVSGGKIASISPGVDLNTPNTINLTSLTLMPGFIDCHDHLGIDIGDEVAQANEPLAYTTIKGVRNAREILFKGVTTVRDVGEQEFFDVSLRRAINEGLIEGPDLLICGKFITRTGGHGWFFGNEVDGIEEIRKSVREQLKNQVDWIKIMISGGSSTPGSVVDMAEYSEGEVAACIQEAHRANRKVAGHIHGGPGAAWAIKNGIDTIEHGTFLEEGDLIEMAKKGVWLVSTVGLKWAVLNSKDSPHEYIRKAEASIEVAKNLLRKARLAGVKLAYGGDTYHGHPAIQVAFQIEAGFSPMESIQIVTRNGALLCGLGQEVGSVEIGKVANLVAVDGNPLDDPFCIEKVLFVMKRGHIYLSPEGIA